MSEEDRFKLTGCKGPYPKVVEFSKALLAYF
jgi:hypothetical protein